MVFSQGTVRGKITEENGEELIGATIVIKNTTIGTSTDLEGNYNLKIASKEPQTLIISFIGNKTIEKIVNPKNGEVIIVNITMVTDSKVIDAVNVVAKTDRATENYVRLKARSAAISIDYISKETIKKTGDSQVDDAMKRITGVSTVGGYISVRGLADRYVKTTINGSRIPTLDPLKNNIKLDMIPTSLIDNIIISKTISPDLPGDWAGSFVSIQTKDYPEKLMITVKSSVGYNPQSSFASIISSEKSSTDWLGFDNNFRDISHASVENFPQYNEEPTGYEMLDALGLGTYMKTQGITADNIPEKTQTNLIKNEYYKLGLVELGLLAPNLLNDNIALSEASAKYNNDPAYREKALSIINQDATKFGSSLPNNWFPSTRSTNLDFSQDIAIGNQRLFWGRKLGYLIGFRYGSSVEYDPGIYLEEGIYSEVTGNFSPYQKWWRKDAKETNQWGAICNLAYQISPFNTISLMFMPNFIGENQTKLDSGFYAGSDPNALFKSYIIRHDQVFEERRQMLYQLQSTNLLPASKIKIELDVSYYDGQRNAPDFKSLQYGESEDQTAFQFQYGYDPKRRYRYLNEDLFDSRASIEIPLFKESGMVRKLKFGGAHTYTQRESKQYEYFVKGDVSGGSEYTVPKNEMIHTFSQESFAMGNNYYVLYDRPSNFAKGEQSITAAYAMTDFNINRIFRFSGGLRIEYTNLYSDLLEFYRTGLPSEVNARQDEKGYVVNPTISQNIDYLPSINIVYKIITRENVAVVARSNYSKSLARPSIRELSSYRVKDFSLGSMLVGNPQLKQVTISNYDCRLESFFTNNDNISISMFYKTFENHIELVYDMIARSYSWKNAIGIGSVLGIEFEGRKEIVKSLELLGNISYMKSEVTIEEGITDDAKIITRELYGQAPYIVNSTIAYSPQKLGLTVSASYNMQGPKLAFITTSLKQPDIYELPRHRIDFKIAKKIGEHFSAEIKIRDMLGTKTIWAYDKDNFSQEFKSYCFGTDYSFSISYDL